MGTHTNNYEPSQEVYVIAECIDPGNAGRTITAVRPGKVIRVRFVILVTDIAPGPLYEVQVDRNPGITELEETDVFVDLSSAVTEYALRLM
jgi:hypothetical protein